MGDLGLTLGILGIYYCFRSLDYYTVFSTVPNLSTTTVTVLNHDFRALDFIGLLLFVGAVGKSAQLGLHT
jgi:NADH-quinone oxidoreductase subunit L